MDGITLERVGFWGLLVIYVMRDGIIPIANKYIPSKIKVSEREQDREDKRLEFEQQMELRHVEALEGIEKVLVVMNERLERIDKFLEKKPKPQRKG